MTDEEYLELVSQSIVPREYGIIVYAIVILFLFLFPYWIVSRWDANE
jgi:hypothetical protein